MPIMILFQASVLYFHFRHRPDSPRLLSYSYFFISLTLTLANPPLMKINTVCLTDDDACFIVWVCTILSFYFFD